MKKLVAYFSATGETAIAARQLAKAAGADLFAIKPKVPYMAADLDWNNKDSRSSIEMRSLIRPEIADRVEDMADYDVVFLGFPIWWYIAPTIINGFLESYDFTGKTIVPFITSGSSGIEKAQAVLQAQTPAANWIDGKRMTEEMTIEDFTEWVKELGFSD